MSLFISNFMRYSVFICFPYFPTSVARSAHDSTAYPAWKFNFQHVGKVGYTPNYAPNLLVFFKDYPVMVAHFLGNGGCFCELDMKFIAPLKRRQDSQNSFVQGRIYRKPSVCCSRSHDPTPGPNQMIWIDGRQPLNKMLP